MRSDTDIWNTKRVGDRYIDSYKRRYYEKVDKGHNYYSNQAVHQDENIILLPLKVFFGFGRGLCIGFGAKGIWLKFGDTGLWTGLIGEPKFTPFWEKQTLRAKYYFLLNDELIWMPILFPTIYMRNLS